MAPILVDTNILVYAHDRGESAKQERAMLILQRLQLAGVGRLSVQCLAEFYWATTRGTKPKLTVAEATLQVERLARAFPVLDVTPLIVLEATRGARDRGMPYWDAQIWAAARLNQVAVVFSEDFNAGSVIDGVRFVNPFAADFRIADWVA
jgi:predicted nucleic acid-binding protein